MTTSWNTHRFGRRRFLKSAAVAAGAASALPLQGLARASATSPSVARFQTPTRGGVLRVGIYSDFAGFDPHVGVSGALDTYHFWALNQGLTRWGPMQDEPLPALAESWEWSEDNRTITFHLRQGARFHNGKEVTSEDVQFSWERLIDPELGAGGEAVRQVRAAEQIEYPDKYTVRVTTTEPLATAPIHFGLINIVPPEWSEDNPIGAGPFVFESWERNQVTRFRRFDDYWDEGLPYLDAVELYPAPDEDVKLLRLQAGEFDFIDGAPLGRLDSILADENLVLYAAEEPLMYYWIIPNLRVVEPLQDYRVRQAISLAIDRPQLQNVLFDASALMWSRVHEAHWAFSPEAIRYDERDLDRARQLLDEAGYANGFELDMITVIQGFMYPTVAEFVQANLQEVGINLRISPSEPASFHDALSDGTFEIALTGMNPPGDPDMIYSWPIEGIAREMSGWADFAESEETLDLIAQGRRIIDLEERQQIYWQVHELDMEYQSSWVINQLLWFHVGSRQVQGYEFFIGTGIPNFRSVWLEE